MSSVKRPFVVPPVEYRRRWTLFKKKYTFLRLRSMGAAAVKKTIRRVPLLGTVVLTPALTGPPQDATARSIDAVDAVQSEPGSAQKPTDGADHRGLPWSIFDLSVTEKLLLGRGIIPSIRLRPYRTAAQPHVGGGDSFCDCTYVGLPCTDTCEGASCYGQCPSNFCRKAPNPSKSNTKVNPTPPVQYRAVKPHPPSNLKSNQPASEPEPTRK
jgi:hypothetical protein